MDEDRLIVQNIGLAASIAHRMADRCGSFGERIREELVSQAFLKLVEEARRFDESYGVPFAAFVRPLIKGFVVDRLRKELRWRKMHVELGDVLEWGFKAPTECESVEHFIQDEDDLLQAIALAPLDRREKLVVELRLYQELWFKDIGGRLRVSEQRAFAIFKGAMEKVRSTFTRIRRVHG